VKRNMLDFTSREFVCAAAHSLISTATATNRNILWNITIRRFFLLGHRIHSCTKPARRPAWGEMLPKHAYFREKCGCIRAPRAEDRCGIALHSAQETALERSSLRAETQRRRREGRSGSLGLTSSSNPLIFLVVNRSPCYHARNEKLGQRRSAAPAPVGARGASCNECAQPATRVQPEAEFFTFFRRNPLKRPVSAKEIKANARTFAFICLNLFARNSRPDCI
jgi:hypothetical protein